MICVFEVAENLIINFKGKVLVITYSSLWLAIKIIKSRSGAIFSFLPNSKFETSVCRSRIVCIPGNLDCLISRLYICKQKESRALGIVK